MGRILIAVAVVCSSQVARADTFVFGGVQVSLPDEGYGIQSGRMASIVNKEKKLIIEMYRFTKVPKATKEQIAEIMKPRQNTTEVDIIDAKRVEQHGVQVTSAEGTARILDTRIRFLLVGVPVDDRAIVAVGYIPRGDETTHRKEIEAILASIRKTSDETVAPQRDEQK